jgi:hypothetical protein
MNKLVKQIGFSCALVLMLLAITTNISSCAKQKPCKANVTVLDANNNPVGGATVKLEPVGTGPNPTIAPIQGSTDASGKVSFETQLPKIMDVIIIVGTNTYTTGKVVRFEEGKTDDVVVNI